MSSIKSLKHRRVHPRLSKKRREALFADYAKKVWFRRIRAVAPAPAMHVAEVQTGSWTGSLNALKRAKGYLREDRPSAGEATVVARKRLCFRLVLYGWGRVICASLTIELTKASRGRKA